MEGKKLTIIGGRGYPISPNSTQQRKAKKNKAKQSKEKKSEEKQRKEKERIQMKP